MIPAHLLNSNKFDWTHVYLKRSNAYHLAYPTRFYSPHTHKSDEYLWTAQEARPSTVGGLLWVCLDFQASCQWVLVRPLGEITHKDPSSFKKSEEIWCQVPVRFSNLGRTALELLKSTQWDKSRTNSYSARLVEFRTSGCKTKLVMYPESSTLNPDSGVKICYSHTLINEGKKP